MFKAALKKLIHGYHWLISPWLGTRCRYLPTCSDYAQQALDQHGVCKGLWLSGKRICRCHPWGGEGYDPVPPVEGSTNAEMTALDRHTENQANH